MKKRALLQCCILLCLCLLGSFASADNFRPAYLQLAEHRGDFYDIRWTTPAQSEVLVMPVKPVFPAGSQITRSFVSSYANGAAVMLGQIRVSRGLEGRTLRFDGLTETGNQVLVRFIRMDGSEDLYQVSPNAPQVTIPKEPDSISVSARYTQLGTEHIWFGFDHLLFVAALFMLVSNLRTLFWTISSFTVAHSITLALVTFDVIRVPAPPVEAFIALSIVFVAVEAVRKSRGDSTLASRKPWVVAFSFGLLHGLGFASALAAIGLPRANVPLALLFFNVGVEIGQIVFVAALLAMSMIAHRLAQGAQLKAARLVSCYGIGGLASYWLIDRIVAFA
jgi:hypothetical protein